jgi:xanthine dehydrogenase accessory factor
VILTEDHHTDEAALRAVTDTPAPCVGTVGSRRKVQITLGHLCEGGVAEPDLARVRAPIGLDLGGRGPAQIALAILADVELVRHGGTCRPRSGGFARAAHDGVGTGGSLPAAAPAFRSAS